MPMPEIAKQVGERITYKPVVAEVSVHSSYNKPGSKLRFALKGVGDKDDFWALDKGVLDLHPELGELPAVGTLGVWTLQKALVTGQYAGTPDRPKYYRDAIKFEKVPDGYVAPAVTQIDPNAPSWTGGKDEPVAQEVASLQQYRDAKAQAVSAYDDREARTRISIEQQTAFRGYAEVLAALATVKVVPMWPLADETDAVQRIVEDFMRLGAILSHLPPMPTKPEETPDAQS